jgi:L-cysteine desulfidase
MIGAFSPAPAAAGSGNISLSIPLQVINSQDYDREQLVNEVGERVVTAMEKVLENRP